MAPAAFFSKRSFLEEASKVHSRIKAGDFLRVAVKRQSRPTAVFAYPSLSGLAPAGMIDRRIDVCIKAILARRRHVPRTRRLPLSQSDFDDRLDPFEAVFPGHQQTQRRSI